MRIDFSLVCDWPTRHFSFSQYAHSTRCQRHTKWQSDFYTLATKIDQYTSINVSSNAITDVLKRTYYALHIYLDVCSFFHVWFLLQMNVYSSQTDPIRAEEVDSTHWSLALDPRCLSRFKYLSFSFCLSLACSFADFPTLWCPIDG